MPLADASSGTAHYPSRVDEELDVNEDEVRVLEVVVDDARGLC